MLKTTWISHALEIETYDVLRVLNFDYEELLSLRNRIAGSTEKCPPKIVEEDNDLLEHALNCVDILKTIVRGEIIKMYGFKILDTILENNNTHNYTTKWEIACFLDNTSSCPDDVIECELIDYDFFVTQLGCAIISNEYKKIQISLIGQDKDGHNETCYNFKTITINEDK